jgi:hypothetical protein
MTGEVSDETAKLRSAAASGNMNRRVLDTGAKIRVPALSHFVCGAEPLLP